MAGDHHAGDGAPSATRPRDSDLLGGGTPSPAPGLSPSGPPASPHLSAGSSGPQKSLPPTGGGGERGRGVHCWGLPGRRAGPEGPSLCPRTDGQGVPRPVPPPPQVAPPLVREFPAPLPPGLFCDPPCRAPAPLSTPWEREGWTFPLHLRPSSWPREGSKWLCLTLRVLSPQSLAGPGGPTPSSRCPAAGRPGCRGPAQCSKSYVWALSRR